MAILFSLRKVCMAAILLPLLGSWDLPAQTADDLFNDNVVHDLRIAINSSDWQALKTNFAANTYYPCDFEWRELVVRDIGIRSRGKTSRSSAKPGLRVDFNRYEDNQHFLGLKSVVLDNNTQDPSMLRERVSMLFLRRMGIPAPREASARLYVNGAYVGLYTLVESVDKSFLKRNFREDDGHLYKYEPNGDYHFEYLGAEISKYVPVPFEPHTHEKDGNHAPLVAMIRTMNQASDADFAQAMSEYLDLKAFMGHAAVENFLANGDGILAVHNFYLYRFEGKNLFQFIPWDTDRSFFDIEFSILRGTSDSVLMRRAFVVPALRQAYLETLFASALSANGWLEPEILRASSQIRSAVLEDPVKPSTNAEFEAAVASNLEFARRRSDYVVRAVSSAGLAAGLRVSQASLRFEAPAGASPARQTLVVSSATSLGLNWSASVSGANWLEVTPTSGVTPATLTAGVAASGLAPGKYSATIVISAGTTAIPSISVPVELTVLARNAPRLNESGAVNAATFSPGALAPGSLISVFGERLTTAAVQASSLPLPTELAGFSLRINGIPAPVLFVSPGQANVQVPWEVASGTASIAATVSGVPSNTISATIGPYSPGIFVVVNADGSPVTAEQPAERGKALVVYATGLGPVTGRAATGQAAPTSPLAATLETPAVTMGDAVAEVLFSGLTPGFVGLYQVNLRVPPSAPTGSRTSLTLQIGGKTAPPVFVVTR